MNQDNEETILDQAAYWLIELSTAEKPNPEVNACFFAWVKQSPAHLLQFMEMAELERRLKRLAPTVEETLRQLPKNQPD